jgi:hypothetical protein
VRPPHLRTALVSAAATVATVAAVLLPVQALHAAPAGSLGAPAAGNLAVPAAGSSVRNLAAAEVDSGLGPCTVVLDDTDWYLDPCPAVGDPLPQDIIDALAEVDRDRILYPSGTPSPTEPPATGPPGPAPTNPNPCATATIAGGIPARFPAGAHYENALPTGPPTTTVTEPFPTTGPPTVTPTLSPSSPPSSPPTSPPSSPPTTIPTTTPPPTTPSGCPTFPTAEPTTTDPSPTPCEIFDPDGNPIPCPTETVTDPPPTPTETPTTTTTPPTSTPTTPSPTPTDTCTPTAAPPPDDKPILESADKDRMGQRDPAKIECDKRVVLTATGDSLTSAHFQWGFGPKPPPCVQTAADARGLTGNHAFFSYAGRYYNANANIVKYYNFARTGFGTTEMLGNPGAAAGDSCGNPWARAAAPVGLSEAVIRQAKRDGYKAYHVTTGGVNNTNWTDVLGQITTCRGLEWAQANLMPRGTSRFWWAAVGGKAGIVTNGGNCVLQVFNPFNRRRDAFFRIAVPRYNGPAQLPVVTADVTTTVNKLLGAGADKIVWMLYYDITLANVDIGNFGYTWLRGKAPGFVRNLMPPRGRALNVALIDPGQAVAVRGLITALNNAIIAGIPANAKVATQAGVLAVVADIQNTAIGGSPHPSAAGHTKMSNALAAKFTAIP